MRAPRFKQAGTMKYSFLIETKGKFREAEWKPLRTIQTTTVQPI